MDIERLREFCILADHSNYTRAARFLNMSQSALSKHIASLEAELRIPLFVRNTTQIALTPQGQIALNAAKVLLADFEKLKDIANSYRVITVGGEITNYQLIARLNDAARRVGEKNGALQLSYVPTLSRPAKATLLEGGLDLFVNYENVSVSHGISKRLFYRDSMLAFCEHGRLGDRSSVSLEDLRNLVFIQIVGQGFDNGFDLGWGVLESLCLKHGFNPARKTIAFANEMEAQTMDISGDCCAVVAESAYAVQQLKQRPDLDAIPVDDETYDYYLYYADPPRNKGVESLIGSLCPLG